MDWKRRTKHVLGGIAMRTGLHRALLRNHATILVFHRVDDRCEGNPISCTSDQFAAYCRFLRHNFQVTTVQEIVTRVRDGHPLEASVAITFDDGYRDNHEVAAPILEEWGLPATFFIATDLIGTETQVSWDRELGVTSEWMSWNQVRDLSERGFELGAHTLNHVNLGEVTGEPARREIQGSKDRLEAELSRAVDLFSYPFGRRDEMVDENRAIVKEAGFRCCLSAYGGAVTLDSDLFDLPRLAVSPWYASPSHLGWEMIHNRR